MYPLVRLVKSLVGASRRSRLGPFDESVVRFRVWPGDLDTNRHLNNGRYLTLMDLGRWDLTGRTGLLREAVRRRWMPVVVAATMRFRRPLGFLQGFELRTRLLGWDETSFYIAQSFHSNGKVCAEGAVRAMMLDGRRKVPPQEVMELVQSDVRSPELPAWVLRWEDAMRGQTAAEAAPAGAVLR